MLDKIFCCHSPAVLPQKGCFQISKRNSEIVLLIGGIAGIILSSAFGIAIVNLNSWVWVPLIFSEGISLVTIVAGIILVFPNSPKKNTYPFSEGESNFIEISSPSMTPQKNVKNHKFTNQEGLICKTHDESSSAPVKMPTASKPLPPHRFCIASDRTCNKHYTSDDAQEIPDRFIRIDQKLRKSNLLSSDWLLSMRQATWEELNYCHTESYINSIKRRAGNLKSAEDSTRQGKGGSMISKDSYFAAQHAVGSVLSGIDQIFKGSARQVFCNVRPPGHHAHSDKSVGISIFNHVAIGARYVQNKYNIRRVLIVDWDVHHGDGTQSIFYQDETVFYFSTHEEHDGLQTGLATETGKGKGKTFTLNVPIPGLKKLKTRENTKEKVIDAFNKQLIPAMDQFQPEFILISCGFDGHKNDPIGGFNLEANDYATLTQIVNQIAKKYAQGRVLSVLEGGYNLEALEESAAAHVKALLQGGFVE